MCDCHSIVVVGILRLTVAIQHFTNGSFPYVYMDVVAMKGMFSLKSANTNTVHTSHVTTVRVTFFKEYLG